MDMDMGMDMDMDMDMDRGTGICWSCSLAFTKRCGIGDEMHPLKSGDLWTFSRSVATITT